MVGQSIAHSRQGRRRPRHGVGHFRRYLHQLLLCKCHLQVRNEQSDFQLTPVPELGPWRSSKMTTRPTKTGYVAVLAAILILSTFAGATESVSPREPRRTQF